MSIPKPFEALFVFFRDLAWILFRALCQDRIRASPLEGLLLRSRPPFLIRWDRTVIQVLRRRVEESSEGTSVSFDCLDPSGPSRIRLDPRPSRNRVVIWEREKARISRFESEIEVMGGDPSR